MVDIEAGTQIGADGERYPIGDPRLQTRPPRRSGAIGLPVNARAFGAVGDGEADDTDAIQAAIDAANERGGGLVDLTWGRFLVTRPLWLDSDNILAGAGMGAAWLLKPDTFGTELTEDALAGATSVEVDDPSGFVVGHAIHLYDTSSFEWKSTDALVTDIDGSTVTFDTPLAAALQTGRDAKASTSFSFIRNISDAERITVRDLSIDGNAGAGDPQAADFVLSPIHWVQGYECQSDRVEVVNSCADGYSDQGHFSEVSDRNNRNTFRDGRITNSFRHGVHVGSAAVGAIIEGNHISDCPGFGYFYCAYARYGVATGNVIEACGAGFAGGDTRDTGNVISNNVILRCEGWGVEFSVLVTDEEVEDPLEPASLVVSNNVIMSNGGADSKGIVVNLPGAIVTGNRVLLSGAATEGINVLSAADGAVLTGNRVTRPAPAPGTIGMSIAGASDVVLSGNSVSGTATGFGIQDSPRLRASGNVVGQFNGTDMTSQSWNFIGVSPDCVIDGTHADYWGAEETGTPTTAPRLVVNGWGNNGTQDPRTGGPWHATTLYSEHNGTGVRWTDGGTKKLDLYFAGMGWVSIA